MNAPQPLEQGREARVNTRGGPGAELIKRDMRTARE